MAANEETVAATTPSPSAPRKNQLYLTNQERHLREAARERQETVLQPLCRRICESLEAPDSSGVSERMAEHHQAFPEYGELIKSDVPAYPRSSHRASRGGKSCGGAVTLRSSASKQGQRKRTLKGDHTTTPDLGKRARLAPVSESRPRPSSYQQRRGKERKLLPLGRYSEEEGEAVEAEEEEDRTAEAEPMARTKRNLHQEELEPAAESAHNDDGWLFGSPEAPR
jgi:hypothetical protein